MIDLLKDDDSKFLVLEKLSEKNLNNSFSVEPQYEEYRDFLYKDALLYQSLLISKTYLLIERDSRNIVAYISLAADTVALKPQEKRKSNLTEIPFLFLPALKITKLAVASGYSEKYKHVGSRLIEVACDKAYRVNEDFMACCIVSVDADIENNPKVVDFYKKNGFLPLKSNIYKRKFPLRTKIIGMWKNIL
jgi:hypothetical protein